jgi:hypothetical protein
LIETETVRIYWGCDCLSEIELAGFYLIRSIRQSIGSQFLSETWEKKVRRWLYFMRKM